MVRCRPAALAGVERTSVVPGILVVTRAGPLLAILRIRRPQVVQVGGHLESEFCLVALCRQLDTEVPEVVRHDVDSSTTGVAIDQTCSVGGKFRKGLRQIIVVSPVTGVPRHDFVNFQFDWLAASARHAARTRLTGAILDVLALSSERHVFAPALHIEFADLTGIPEAKGKVLSTGVEKN